MKGGDGGGSGEGVNAVCALGGELEGYRQVLRKMGMGISGAWVGALATLDSVLRVPAKNHHHLASPFGCPSCW